MRSALDSRRVAWRRVLDMNDRALREIVCSLGGVANGYPREAGFDITVASEVMAIFCLARDLDDLKHRLGNVIIGYTRDRKPVRAADLKAHGAMTALLKDALAPNLVQTLEGTPAFVHGGPFANIAHGCNSVLATTTALKLTDYVVTEAGFGADLGGEKFIDIKCRKTGLAPDCVVLVATIRALKMHGGVKKEDLKTENLKALEAGMANLARHVENVQKFGLVPVISINRFSADTPAEIELVKKACAKLGVEALMADHWAMGGEGAADVAQARWCKIDRVPARASSSCSIPTKCRCWKRSAPSRGKSTAPRTSRPTRRCATSSPPSRRWATASFRSASPRPSTASPPTRTSRARRTTTSSRCARCGCRRAPSSWWRSAATS